MATDRANIVLAIVKSEVKLESNLIIFTVLIVYFVFKYNQTLFLRGCVFQNKMSLNVCTVPNSAAFTQNIFKITL